MRGSLGTWNQEVVGEQGSEVFRCEGFATWGLVWGRDNELLGKTVQVLAPENRNMRITWGEDGAGSGG